MSSGGDSISDAPVNKVVDGQDHQLSYITAGEANTLVNQGGVPTMTDSGVMAYPPGMGDPNYDGSGGGTYGGSGGNQPDNNPSNGGDGDNNRPDVGFQEALKDPYNTGNVDAEDEYMSPDRDHYNQTQKDIKESISGLGDNYQADWSDLSKDQKTEYQKNMNEVKGTTDKNYSWYAGNEGTINNTFAENWKDAVVTSPALKYSPTLRFLMASAKTVKQNATTDYGTGNYGGTDFTGAGSGMPVDGGGWLGKISSGQASKDFIGTPQGRDAMNEIAPHAPYMISGITKPTDSPAANWYANLGTGSTNPGGFNLATEYATAKAAISTKLQSRGPIGMLAVSDSPYYDWLKTNKLDKGIL
jgi:hypothetical protein